MRSQRAVHPTKKMHGQVTLLDRPLPPGEGWGEGLVRGCVSSARAPIDSPSEVVKKSNCRTTQAIIASIKSSPSEIHFCLLPSAF